MKKILVLIAIVFAAMQLTAATVDLVSAQQSAQHFLMSQTAKGRFMTSAPTVKWTHEVKNSSNVSLTAYYIVNTDKGFVIVPGDDRADEVLAYGDGCLSSMNDLPESMQFFLDMYKAEMEYLQAHPGVVLKKRNTRDGISVEPMLTTTWNQGTTDGRSPFNRLCPVVNGSYCKVGCAAVSLAQVMNFWEYPASSPALPGYTGPTFGVTVGDLPAYDFDWANIRDYYTNSNWSEAERDAISNLMRYVGQAELMDYGVDLSGADEDQMMRAIRLFGFDSGTHYMLKNDYDSAMTELVTEEEWIATMKAELIAGRPLMYCAGASMSDGSAFYGHAFNVDGYNAETDMYHVNFGGSEEHNTYCAFNNFGYGISVYKYFQLMFVGMQPPQGAIPPRLVVSPQYLLMETYAGDSVTANFTVAGLDLTDDITVTVTDENGYFTTDVATIAMNEAASKTVTVKYAPLAVGEHEAFVTMSTPGAEDVVLPLYGTATQAPLKKYDPVMLPADSANITATSFRADWSDQTPIQNVASYTLEVKTKPNYTLVAEADWSGVGQNYNNMSDNWADIMPEGWSFSGYGLWIEGGYISIGSSASFMTPTLDLSASDKVTVVFNACNTGYSGAPVIVSTSKGSESFTLSSKAFTQCVAVLDCDASDAITFKSSGGYPGFLDIQIYAGVVDAPQMRDAKDGGDVYRLITGITDRFYTVNDLPAEGTYVYKVKSIYIDETESAWSNVEEVTLFGTAYSIGDVNHDGRITISDVTALIDYLLSDSAEAPAEADVNGQGGVTIADVTALIDMLLSNSGN